MEPASFGLVVVVMALVILGQAAALMYVVIRLVRYGSRKPWFFITKDDAGRVERIGALERLVEKPPEVQRPIDIRPGPDEPDIPGLDGPENYEPIGGDEETAERAPV